MKLKVYKVIKLIKSALVSFLLSTFYFQLTKLEVQV